MTEDEERYVRELGKRLGRLERAVAHLAGTVAATGQANWADCDKAVEIIQGKHDETS